MRDIRKFKRVVQEDKNDYQWSSYWIVDSFAHYMRYLNKKFMREVRDLTN